MMALLSSLSDKWQSEQVLVSVVRTVCGKCGATLVSGTNSRKQPTYRCGEQFHLTRQREPVDAMVTEAVLTRLSSVDVHDLVMPQEAAGPDREELLTERNALVERVKELSPLLRDIHQPVLEITAAINDVKARIDEIDAELLDRSVSVAAKLLADVDEPVGTARGVHPDDRGEHLVVHADEGDGVLGDVVAEPILAQHDGDAVGAEDFASRIAKDVGDGLERASAGQAFARGDQP